MLGRHGDNLFWMARYLERSENLSRRIQATLHYALSREDEGEEEWTAQIMNHGLGPLFEEKYYDPTTIDTCDQKSVSDRARSRLQSWG